MIFVIPCIKAEHHITHTITDGTGDRVQHTCIKRSIRDTDIYTCTCIA